MVNPLLAGSKKNISFKVKCSPQTRGHTGEGNKEKLTVTFRDFQLRDNVENVFVQYQGHHYETRTFYMPFMTH